MIDLDGVVDKTSKSCTFAIILNLNIYIQSICLKSEFANVILSSFEFFTALPRKIAKNSKSDSLSVPYLRSFSRGLSILGKSLILVININNTTHESNLRWTPEFIFSFLKQHV